MLAKKVGIDLGTANTRIFVPKKGIVLDEPTVVALDINTNKVLRIGKDAQSMLGRTPETIELYRPLSDGVIADFNITQTMLKHYLAQSLGRINLVRPDVMISLPGGATSTEKKAVIDVALAAGGRAAYIIPSSVAAALGADIPIASPAGSMVIDIGAGTIEIAVLSLGGVVAEQSVRVGGNKINQAIVEHLRKEHNLAIGDHTAEEVKKRIGSALPMKKQSTMKVKGRDIAGGLPKTITVKSNELVDPIQDILEKIVFAIRSALEETQPELVSDIIDRGIILSGGGAKLRNLDKLLSKIIGVPVVVSPRPLLTGIKGIGIALNNLADYQKSLLGGS